MPLPVRVADVMSAPVRTVDPETTAAAAAAECFERDIGSLVVLEDEAVVGIVTGMDLLELLGTVPEPESQPVRAAMSSPVVTIGPAQPVREAVERMREHGVARLAVVDDDELVGLVSTDDVIRYVPQLFHRYELPDGEAIERRYHVRDETAYEEDGWTFECTSVAEEEPSVGDRVEFTKVVDEEDVSAFAAASGDTNRLHLDEAYASQTRFGRRIVHGTLAGGLISAALARLPGLTIYVSQTLSFLSPVDVGERLTAVCEIVDSFGDDKYELTTDVFDADGEQIIEGEATVLVDAPPESARIELEPI